MLIDLPEVSFDWTDIESIMLGARINESKSSTYRQIPTSPEANSLLEEVLHATWAKFKELKGTRKQVRKFELPELYAAKEAVYAPTDRDVFAEAVHLYEKASQSTPITGHLNDEVRQMGLYFAVFHDGNNEKVIGCKQVRSFKASLKRSHWMLFWQGKYLRPVDQTVFTLDSTFDYLITKDGVIILSPAQFVQTSVGSAALRDAMSAVVPTLRQRCSFVAFDRFAGVVKKSVEAAKLIASIKDKEELVDLTEKQLTKDLKKLEVGFEKVEGLVAPKKGEELHFLQYLDDRLLSPEWKKGRPRHLVAKARLPRERAGDSADEATEAGDGQRHHGHQLHRMDRTKFVPNHGRRHSVHRLQGVLCRGDYMLFPAGAGGELFE